VWVSGRSVGSSNQVDLAYVTGAAGGKAARSGPCGVAGARISVWSALRNCMKAETLVMYIDKWLVRQLAAGSRWRSWRPLNSGADCWLTGGGAGVWPVEQVNVCQGGQGALRAVEGARNGAELLHGRHSDGRLITVRSCNVPPRGVRGRVPTSNLGSRTARLYLRRRYQ